ncbi:MAG: oxygen-independent coproporphyrinogen III oxidase [Planctomycetota bacterium]
MNDALNLPSAEFLERYDVVAPRYTSYPTAPVWTPTFGAEAYRDHLRSLAAAAGSTATGARRTGSLYFHIPFCEHRCAFCACNVIISKRQAVANPYVASLTREMALVREAFPLDLDIQQMHWGGGTPNYLTEEQFRQLVSAIRARFQFHPDAEISIEVDPRHTSPEQIALLRELGFNRLSFGVQDFDPRVQAAIDRHQTVEQAESAADAARKNGFLSVNFDLIYGLPYQTQATFAATLETVKRLSPDRIALYNFAYLPARLKHQEKVDVEALPRGVAKFDLFLQAVEGLTAAGYEYIGMDHFAKPQDDLAVAWRERTIQRNFMGYTTRAGHDLFSFGTSSISLVGDAYAQNVKHLATFEREVAEGRLPIERGLKLSAEDLLRKRVISDLMCFGRCEKSAVEREFHIDFDRHFAAELQALAPVLADGLAVVTNQRVEVTALGQAMLRNVAVVFDAYLLQPNKPQTQFSRAV